MKKEYEMLIQKKVDGLLSPSEEKQIDKLIEQYTDVRDHYNEIKKVDKLLESDAKSTTTFDNAHSIMNAIGNSHFQQRKPKRRLLTPMLMKYAAILILGVFTGTVFTYTYFNSNKIDDTILSGTMAHKIDKQSLFADRHTKIELQTINSQEIKIAILRVETDELINFEIHNTGKEQVQIVALKNKTNLAGLSEPTKQFAIAGNTTFQVIFNSKNTPELKFVRSNKMIARKKIR